MDVILAREDINKEANVEDNKECQKEDEGVANSFSFELY